MSGVLRRGWWAVCLLAGLAQAWSLAWPWAGVWHGQPLPWLQCVSLCPLLAALCVAPTARGAALRGWLFAIAWLAGTFWWLFISMHVYGGLAAPWAAASVLALAVFLGGYYAVAAGVFWRWRAARPGVQACAFAACWTLAEWARGTWFTGFPWGAGGYAQVDALAALAPAVGVYGLGAASAGLAAGVVAWWRTAPLGGAGGARGPLLGWACGGGAVLLGLLPMLSPPVAQAWQAAWPDATEPHGRLPVVLLQGNVPQNEKFDTHTGVQLSLDWYGARLREAVASPDAALVVAPETAIPVLPQDMDPGYWRGLLQAVAAGRSAVLLGLPLGNWDDGFTNSVAGWVPGAQAMHRYDKHHLVPFGEFIPPLFRWFTNLMNIPLGDFNRGALGQAPLAWGGQRIAPNICYEDLFGEELAVGFRDPASAPTVLVNLSNIAWFGDSVAIDQHRHISRLRALELGRPMLRATNTGATAVIDHRGRVTHELPRLTRGVLHAEAEGRTGLTPYARWAGRWGLWPVVVLCLCVLAAAWRWRQRA